MQKPPAIMFPSMLPVSHMQKLQIADPNFSAKTHEKNQSVSCHPDFCARK